MYFDDTEEKFAGFITWQENIDGRLVDLPRIEESHEEIVFREWQIRLKHVETTIFNARDISNNLIETINDNLFKANLI